MKKLKLCHLLFNLHADLYGNGLIEDSLHESEESLWDKTLTANCDITPDAIWLV